MWEPAMNLSPAPIHKKVLSIMLRPSRTGCDRKVLFFQIRETFRSIGMLSMARDII